MEFWDSLFGLGEFALDKVFSLLVVLTIVVFIHELGHFLVARWCGVRIDAFSIGFGPELFGFNDKRGTRWRFAIIPLGGYVKFAGDNNGASVPDHETLAQMSDEDKEGAFHLKPLWQRASVVAAGPIANFILAIAIFAGLFMISGKQFTPARADAVIAGSAAEAGGFKAGDLILSIDGNPVESFFDVRRTVSTRADEELSFEVRRGEEVITLKATPKPSVAEGTLARGKVGLLGIQQTRNPDELIIKHYGPLEALSLGVAESWGIVEDTFHFLGRMFTGKQSADQLSGPIGIADMVGKAASANWSWLIPLTAALSVSIGLINLFPIPILDGGHLMFYLAEAIRGRPLSEGTQEIAFRLGFTAIILLLVFVSWNDIRLSGFSWGGG
ncbi:RIP metalloprotease RseP [Coralliovum pocilloporae]|uniref:RIP metalloprotease RseP n=1 Tax=Coralliovum pocilloporae TaxID=3066369 RepID=UPI003307534D